MAENNIEDLRFILREQQDLRLRLEALDQRIAGLRRPASAAAKDKVPETPPPLPPLPVAPILTKEEAKPVEPAASMPQTVPVFSAPRLPELREPSPTPVPAAPRASLEFKLGTVWLVRIGIVMLLTGLVFLGNYAWHYLIHQIGPLGKIALLYLAGGGLAALGARLERRSESLRNYGRVLLAGGVAAVYYTTYAATFVQRLQVIHSSLIGGLLLLLIAGAVVWLAERRQSQSVALTAILLSYYTSAINPLGGFSLFSSLVLTSAAVFFLVRHRWTTLSFLSLVGTYVSFAFWSFYRTGHLQSSFGQTSADFWLGSAFLLGYWLLFTAAVFLSRAENFPAEKRTPFLSINNGAFFALMAPSVATMFPGDFGRFCLGYGVVLLALAWVAQRRQNEDRFLDGAYLIQGLGMVTLGLVAEFTGYQLSLALAVQSSVLLVGMRRRHGWIYEIAAATAAIWSWLILAGDSLGDDIHDGSRGVATVLFLFNGWLCKNWRRPPSAVSFEGRTAGYGLLALFLIFQVITHRIPLQYLETGFIVAGLLFAFGFPFLRLGEIGILSQGYVVLGVVGWSFSAHPELAHSWTLVAVILGPLILTHRWCRQSLVGEVFFSMLLLAVGGQELVCFLPDSQLSVAFAATAMGALVYGFVFQAIVLAVLGQLLIFCSAAYYFRQVLWLHAAWPWPTSGLGLLAVDLVLLRWMEVRLTEKIAWGDKAREVIHFWESTLTLLLFGMIAVWGGTYVDVPGRMLFFTLLAALQMFLAAQKPTLHSGRTNRLLAYSAASIFLAMLVFWSALFGGDPPQRLDVVGLLVLAVLQRWGLKWFAGTEFFPRPAQQLVIVAVVSGLWLLGNHWLDFYKSTFPKTVAWTLLAAASLATGLAFRERPYRLLGLVLLAAAVLRIVCFDVWQLETLYRILSFMVLGVVLLGISFVYNKFADKLREWL